MGKITLGRYVEMMEKAKNRAEAYKIYEKYGPEVFGYNLNDFAAVEYWKVNGEAEAEYGKVEFFESCKTLEGKMKQPDENEDYRKFMKNLLDEGDRTGALKIMPEKCNKCGFHRFFGIRIDFTSIGHYVTVFCPACRIEFGYIDADSGDIVRTP